MGGSVEGIAEAEQFHYFLNRLHHLQGLVLRAATIGTVSILFHVLDLPFGFLNLHNLQAEPFPQIIQVLLLSQVILIPQKHDRRILLNILSLLPYNLLQLIIHQLELMPQLLQKSKHILALLMLSLLFLLNKELDHPLELDVHHALDLTVVDGWLELFLAEGVVSQVVGELEKVYLEVFVVLGSLLYDFVGLGMHEGLDLELLRLGLG